MPVVKNAQKHVKEVINKTSFFGLLHCTSNIDILSTLNAKEQHKMCPTTGQLWQFRSHVLLLIYDGNALVLGITTVFVEVDQRFVVKYYGSK